MARKPKMEKDKSERWMLTYADLMNLLLVLFILLYSLGQTDKAKAQAVAVAVQQGFNQSSSQVAALQAYWSSSNNVKSTSSANDQYTDFYAKLMKLIQDSGLQDKVVIKADDRGVVISLSDNVLFAPGSADLNPTATQLVVNIGNIIKQVTYSQIIVEGHTDSDPIHNAKYKDNLDLSTMRANNVNRIFSQSCGIDPKTMSSLGYGENRPLVPNDSTANKAKNRRVVITILRQVLDPNAVIAAENLISSLNAASSAANQQILASSVNSLSSSKAATSSKSSSKTANTSTGSSSVSGTKKSTSSK
jgi:chemotaxis protein MotB